MFVYNLKKLRGISGKLSLAIFLMALFFMCSPKIYSPPSIRLDQTTSAEILKSLFGNDYSSNYKLKPGDVLEISYIQIYPFVAGTDTAPQAPTLNFFKIPLRIIDSNDESLKEYEKLFLTTFIGTNLVNELNIGGDKKGLDKELIRVWNNFINSAEISICCMDHRRVKYFDRYEIINIDNIFAGTIFQKNNNPRLVDISYVRNDNSMIRFYRPPFIEDFYNNNYASPGSDQENYYYESPMVIYFSSITINGINILSPQGEEKNWTLKEWIQSEAIYYSHFNDSDRTVSVLSNLNNSDTIKLIKLKKFPVPSKVKGYRPRRIKVYKNPDKPNAILSLAKENDLIYLRPKFMEDNFFNFLMPIKIAESELNKVYPSMVNKILIGSNQQ